MDLIERLRAIRGGGEKPTEYSLTIGWAIYAGPTMLEVKASSDSVEYALRAWNILYPDIKFHIEPVLGLINYGGGK